MLPCAGLIREYINSCINTHDGAGFLHQSMTNLRPAISASEQPILLTPL